MGQPMGTCYLLKSKYLRLVIAMSLSKNPRDRLHNPKPAAVNSSQRNPDVLTNDIPKNTLSRMMKKIGHRNIYIGGVYHAFSPYSPHTQLCTLLQQNKAIWQSLSVSVGASCSPEAADSNPTVQVRISGENAFLECKISALLKGPEAAG